MACETCKEDLEMMNVDFGTSDQPLNTHFLLSPFEEKKLCPRFYGKELDKLKVYDALKKDMHVEVRTKWGELKCHCSRIPILRLSKTARNLNKVFLACGTPASAATRCKYFQWFHTPLFIDKRPIHNLKYATNLSRPEWKKQAEANVEKWKQQQVAWLNQFAESAKKQEEQRKAQTRFPWNSTPLPSTFHSGPEIAKELKKREQRKEVHSIANHLFNSRVKGWNHLPESEASVARYLEKQQSKGHTLSPADEKFLEAFRASKHDEWKPPPGAEKYEKNEAAIANAVNESPFGYLPEKVCSLATYCHNRKKEGLPLTSVQERFFAQLVNVHTSEETCKEDHEGEKRFLQECDATNARRRKCGMAPYSYETFKKVWIRYLLSDSSKVWNKICLKNVCGLLLRVRVNIVIRVRVKP